MLAKNTSIRR